jgi:hypothetical protein
MVTLGYDDPCLLGTGYRLSLRSDWIKTFNATLFVLDVFVRFARKGIESIVLNVVCSVAPTTLCRSCSITSLRQYECSSSMSLSCLPLEKRCCWKQFVELRVFEAWAMIRSPHLRLLGEYVTA